MKQIVHVKMTVHVKMHPLKQKLKVNFVVISVVHVKYLLAEVRRESVKFYMVLLVNTQNIASVAILLYYLLYPQHVQLFNKKMLKVSKVISFVSFLIIIINYVSTGCTKK